MAPLSSSDPDPHGLRDLEAGRRRLAQARGRFYEDPAAALDEAILVRELARIVGDPGLGARACALQGAISLQRGDLAGSLSLAVEAEREALACEEPGVLAEVAALKAQVGFFTGSYGDALHAARQAVELADAADDLALRIYTRRATCPVFANAGVPDLPARIEELLRLTIAAGDPWEEAISRNDLACMHHEQGDLVGAEREIDRALGLARRLTPPNSFALGVIHSTRADIGLLAGRPAEALSDTKRAISLLTASGDPNPYVLGMTVRAEVEARMALGHVDGAQSFGEGALALLGDRVPQTRSLILSTIASTLRRAGRVEEAYDALWKAAELERRAFRELSELRLRLERATLEAEAARRASRQLADRNRQLTEAHGELERRADRMRQLQEQLQDQADRDWLTGLYNRRYLARQLEMLGSEQIGGWFSLAVVDLDHFKAVNDRFGHGVGDRVLVRVASLLGEVLRGSDTVVRSGGEEFLVLMPQADPDAAADCCERIRRAIREEDWEAVVGGLALTVSLGVASEEDPEDLEALARLADHRLYRAKQAGRDRVEAHAGAGVR